jgi:formate dehydrogenase subunit delta
MVEAERLVKMANQIAENLDFHDDAAERVADHLRRFWAPSMRQSLADYMAAGGAGLDPVVKAAVQRLVAC